MEFGASVDNPCVKLLASELKEMSNTMGIYEAVIVKLSNDEVTEIQEVVKPFLAMDSRTAYEEVLVKFMRENSDVKVGDVSVIVRRFGRSSGEPW